MTAVSPDGRKELLILGTIQAILVIAIVVAGVIFYFSQVRQDNTNACQDRYTAGLDAALRARSLAGDQSRDVSATYAEAVAITTSQSPARALAFSAYQKGMAEVNRMLAEAPIPPAPHC